MNVAMAIALGLKLADAASRAFAAAKSAAEQKRDLSSDEIAYITKDRKDAMSALEEAAKNAGVDLPPDGEDGD